MLRNWRAWPVCGRDNGHKVSYTFLNLHALLSENLQADPSACGRLRRRPVDIGGSVYTPLAIPQRIEPNFLTILDKAGRIDDRFET